MDLRQPVKACDPWAVYLATRTREHSGLVGTEGLTEIQKEIYEFIQSKGKVTLEELLGRFNMSESEMRAEFAVLRHSELVKGSKEVDKVYIVPFS